MDKILVEAFLKEQTHLPIVDVRSPSEFRKGHIPGAVNIPLFDDEERAEIGTIYKNEGSYTAIKKGLKLVGPKLEKYVSEVEKLNSEALKIYCWRGGMRSSSMAWLFETAGYTTYLLEGGYKSFRNKILSYFTDDKLQIILLGGETGSGKTDVLNILKEKGEQVVDLESLANHRGSAFGGLGQGAQPTSEHFQNLVFVEFLEMNKNKTIWLEDESSHIGQVGLTETLWSRMKMSPILILNTSFEERVKRLVRDYSKIDKYLLSNAIKRISKKLGGQNVKLALEHLERDEFDVVAGILLKYYDKSYRFLLNRKSKNVIGQVELTNKEETVNKLIQKSQKPKNSSVYVQS